jgi:hypothetical protein
MWPASNDAAFLLQHARYPCLVPYRVTMVRTLRKTEIFLKRQVEDESGLVPR